MKVRYKKRNNEQINKEIFDEIIEICNLKSNEDFENSRVIGDIIQPHDDNILSEEYEEFKNNLLSIIKKQIDQNINFIDRFSQLILFRYNMIWESVFTDEIRTDRHKNNVWYELTVCNNDKRNNFVHDVECIKMYNDLWKQEETNFVSGEKLLNAVTHYILNVIYEYEVKLVYILKEEEKDFYEIKVYPCFEIDC